MQGFYSIPLGLVVLGAWCSCTFSAWCPPAAWVGTCPSSSSTLLPESVSWTESFLASASSRAGCGSWRGETRRSSRTSGCSLLLGTSSGHRPVGSWCLVGAFPSLMASSSFGSVHNFLHFAYPGACTSPLAWILNSSGSWVFSYLLSSYNKSFHAFHCCFRVAFKSLKMTWIPPIGPDCSWPAIFIEPGY